MKTDVYQIITDRIVSLLESGTIPWRKPWKGSSELPKNLISKKSYQGINIWLLHAMGYTSPYWLTYKQAKDLGGSVKRGEKGTPIIFWKFLEKETNEGEKKQVPLLRYFTVFNVGQCEGLSDKLPVTEEPELLAFEPIDLCESIVAAMPNLPSIKHEEPRAYYRPIDDLVNMPAKELFETVPEYYSTLFHELTHSTGHKDRLGRKGIVDVANFGSHTYSKEELVAEFGAAYLCGHCGIETSTIDNSAAYISNWLAKLKNDNKLVVQAAGQAQKATNFILNVKHESEG